jgi:hypothetical protein
MATWILNWSTVCVLPGALSDAPEVVTVNGVALSGGVARQPTDYHLVPLQGTTNPPFGLTPGAAFLTSRIAVVGYPR